MSRLLEIEQADKAKGFWDYSGQIYNKTEVCKRLHQLQDQHSQNINRILFALWLTSQNISLVSPTETLLDHRALAHLEKFLNKLRHLRNSMKDPSGNVLCEFQTIRPQLLALELRLEKHHQQMMIETFLLASVNQSSETLPLRCYQSNLNILGCDWHKLQADFVELFQLIF